MREEKQSNLLRLSQVRFVHTRRRALECPGMRPAYMVWQGLSGVFIQELLEMALSNTAGKGAFGQLLELGCMNALCADSCVGEGSWGEPWF